MEERKYLRVPTVSYRSAKEQEKVDAAYDVLFEVVLKGEFTDISDTSKSGLRSQADDIMQERP